MPWTSACYIIDSEFAEAMIGTNEDPMPLDGNPHLMSGEIPPQPFWALPSYPALGWNAVPQDHQPQQNNQAGWGQNVQQDEGWGLWDQAA